MADLIYGIDQGQRTVYPLFKSTGHARCGDFTITIWNQILFWIFLASLDGHFEGIFIQIEGRCGGESLHFHGIGLSVFLPGAFRFETFRNTR